MDFYSSYNLRMRIIPEAHSFQDVMSDMYL